MATVTAPKKAKAATKTATKAKIAPALLLTNEQLRKLAELSGGSVSSKDNKATLIEKLGGEAKVKKLSIQYEGEY